MTAKPEWFEDLYLGHQVQAIGGTPVTEDQIIDFAEQFDPMPFHVDKTAASQSLFGGVVASGLHSLALVNPLRIKAHGPLRQLAGMGMDDLQWRRPLRPGDSLSILGECVELEAGHRPHAGIVSYQYRVLNQASETVLRHRLRFLVAKRQV